MAARSTRTFGSNKAAFGAELVAMREEFNKLVDEVEELKAHYIAHCHTTGTKPIAVGTGVLSPAITAVDAKKIS